MGLQSRQHPGSPSLVNGGQIAWGGLYLLTGILVYLLARPPGSTAWLPPWLSFGLAAPAALRPLMGAWPTCAHTAAFGLLTASVLGGGRLPTFLACLAWALINTGFEIGQHPAVVAWWIAWPPVADSEATLVHWLTTYWHHGTFDPLDLATAAMGAGLACLVSHGRHHRASPKECRHG